MQSIVLIQLSPDQLGNPSSTLKIMHLLGRLLFRCGVEIPQQDNPIITLLGGGQTLCYQLSINLMAETTGWLSRTIDR